MLSRRAAGSRVLSAPAGRVLLLVGIDAAGLRAAVDDGDAPADGRLALFLPRPDRSGADGTVESVLDRLAETALNLWPSWYGAAAGDGSGPPVEVRPPAAWDAWAKPAARQAAAGRPPRRRDMARAIEFEQLSLAINPRGLVMVMPLDAAEVPADAAPPIHAAEWCARHGAAVVMVNEVPPPPGPPFDRILFAAERVAPDAEGPTLRPAPAEGSDVGLVPVIGRPHPLSRIERAVAEALRRDADLAPLFEWNRRVETVLAGVTPRVDLLWRAGRVVVELDGYPDHGTYRAFIHDRQRDHALLVSGYLVLRIANAEVEGDVGAALQKIRDVVGLRRNHHRGAGR